MGEAQAKGWAKTINLKRGGGKTGQTKGMYAIEKDSVEYKTVQNGGKKKKGEKEQQKMGVLAKR